MILFEFRRNIRFVQFFGDAADAGLCAGCRRDRKSFSGNNARFHENHPRRRRTGLFFHGNRFSRKHALINEQIFRLKNNAVRRNNIPRLEREHIARNDIVNVPFFKLPVAQNCRRHGHFLAQGLRCLRGTIGIHKIDERAYEDYGENNARLKT